MSEHSKIPYVAHKPLMQQNEELRKQRRTFALPDQSGHVAFQMDALSYYAWVAKYPELGASDPLIAKNAWRKFLTSDEGRRYTINPHEGRKTPHHTRGVIVK